MTATPNDQLLEVYADHLEQFGEDVLAPLFHWAESTCHFFPPVAELLDEATEIRRKSKNARIQ